MSKADDHHPSMHFFDEAKIDTPCHIFDPAHFAYATDVPYRPSGQETGSADTFAQVMWGTPRRVLN